MKKQCANFQFAHFFLHLYKFSKCSKLKTASTTVRATRKGSTGVIVRLYLKLSSSQSHRLPPSISADATIKEQFRAAARGSVHRYLQVRPAGEKSPWISKRLRWKVIFLERSANRRCSKGRRRFALSRDGVRNDPGQSRALPDRGEGEGLNNDGLSARPLCAIVPCCGMIQAESRGQTRDSNRAADRAPSPAPSARINHVRETSYILIFTR